jgi:hypothetical protein
VSLDVLPKVAARNVDPGSGLGKVDTGHQPRSLRTLPGGWVSGDRVSGKDSGIFGDRRCETLVANSLTGTASSEVVISGVPSLWND